MMMIMMILMVMTISMISSAIADADDASPICTRDSHRVGDSFISFRREQNQIIPRLRQLHYFRISLSKVPGRYHGYANSNSFYKTVVRST